MARHNIYPTPNPDGTDAENRLELHWQRDGGVQLASTAWMGEAGKPDTVIEYLPSDDKGDTYRAWDGPFVDLTRSQLNHLIKQLRVARDQAFGRDE
jgi:hypothetical protein